jgi:guanine deaminase
MQSSRLPWRLFHGTIIHSLALDQLQFVLGGWLVVSPEGKVHNLLRADGTPAVPPPASFSDQTPSQTQTQTPTPEGQDPHVVVTREQVLRLCNLDPSSVEVEVVEVPRWGFVVPGLVDTHTHAPQYLNAGNGLDRPLLQWLTAYTFPAEAKFSSTEFASRVYKRVVERFLRFGTTTCTYFGTIHAPATKVLAEWALKYGQRALVGKVCMDRNSPENYIEKTSESLQQTEKFCKDILHLSLSSSSSSSSTSSISSSSSSSISPSSTLPSPSDCLVVPILTPRFVPTCTFDLLKGLAQIAKQYDLPIQTHISENQGEVKWVSELHPELSSYAAVYHASGLLTNKTVLAHAVYLTPEEMNLIKEAGSGISHCPNSNFSITSGVLAVRPLLDRGIKVGLGTDISGGYSANLLDAFRLAMIASKITHLNHAQWKPLSNAEGFYLLTLGGASVVDLQHKIGNFLVGKEFDALVVDLLADGSPVDLFDDDGDGNDKMLNKSTNVMTEEVGLRILEKWLNCGDDRNIKQVYVQGKPLFPLS